MSPQYEHELPNGDRLHVIDIATAQEYLPRLVASYEAGNDKAMVIGDETKPTAVVLPVDQWLQLLDLAEAAESDRRLYDAARESLADAEPSVPYRDLLKTINDPRKHRDHE